MKIPTIHNLLPSKRAKRSPSPVANGQRQRTGIDILAETLNVSDKAKKPGRIPIKNLRPSEQQKTGLKGALTTLGGFLGVAATKALRGLKGPMMTGAWEDLLVASYEVPKEALQPYLPEGVELDSWNGKHFMSLVALKSKDIKGLGVRVPGGKDFEQVNLRFYVKGDTPEGKKKGAVFIKQIVPSEIVAWASQSLVNENVVTASMTHKLPDDSRDGEVSYQWNINGSSSKMSAQRIGQAKPLRQGSQEEFLLENYSGFSSQSDGQTTEYKVEHPAWKTWQAVDPIIDVDAEALYGKELARYLSGPPSSVIIVDGSSTAVHTPRAIN
jgi:uncharacterized protein YqjF (DUF2071 family)